MDKHETGQIQEIQINFPTILDGAKNYGDIQTAIGKAVNEKKQKGIDRVGFVSGRLYRESMRKDMDLMRKRTEELREEHRIPIFASTDIFFDTLWESLEETQLTQEERRPLMLKLFREILKSGVTDIYMMPGWSKLNEGEDTNGAIDEFFTAKEIGIRIHDLDPTQPSRWLSKKE